MTITAPTSSRRPFNPALLDSHAAPQKLKASRTLDPASTTISLTAEDFIPVIRADVGSETAVLVRRYRVLLPLAQIIRESADAFRRVTIAGSVEIAALRNMLIQHFGGVTLNVLDPSPLRGVGARDPSNPSESLEENEHAAFEVYAAPLQESDDYFRALRRELQEALGEGVILIERQELTLL